MRVVALFALLFGFVPQLFLDGQPFSHAVLGIVCGIAAMICGWSSARKDPPHQWEGRMMAGLGLLLAIRSALAIPSAYRIQKKFNDRKEGEAQHQSRSPYKHLAAPPKSEPSRFC
jgi:hypothetical protein